VCDLIDALRQRGWQVDLQTWTPPVSSLAWHRGERWLSSNVRWLRDVARLVRRGSRELAAAPSASEWFARLERTVTPDCCDVLLAVSDLAPIGLSWLMTRAPVPAVLVSLVALSQEQAYSVYLPLVRPLARLLSAAPLHEAALRAVPPGQVATAVFASDAWRDAAVASGIPASAAHVIPFGVPVPAAACDRPAVLPSPARLLWAGRLSPEKGLHLFLRALPALRGRVRMTAIAAPGPESYAAEIDRLIARHHLDDIVEIRPALPRQQLVAAFSHHDLLLFHSVFDEPVAQVLLHAAMQELPVVGPSSASPRSLLREGETAWCYDDGHASDQVAAAIDRALAAGPERLRRARALSHDVGAQHAFSLTVDRFDALLQRAVDTSAARTSPCLNAQS
jgi:glycosyltransferase involved in cell wall biosynthesis